MQKEELKNPTNFLQQFLLEEQILLGISAFFLLVHGLIHVFGFVVYWQITADLEELTYKTTILFNTIDIGDVGIKIFGFIWFLVAIGYVFVVINLVRRKNDNIRNQLTVVTIFSLFLTILDFTVAYTGVLFNLLVLAGMFIHYKFRLG